MVTTGGLKTVTKGDPSAASQSSEMGVRGPKLGGVCGETRTMCRFLLHNVSFPGTVVSMTPLAWPRSHLEFPGPAHRFPACPRVP